MKHLYFESHFIYRFRRIILSVFLIMLILLAYFASKVEKSYEYFSTLPKHNAALKSYNKFLNTFKESGNQIVIGIETPHFFQKDFFDDYRKLHYDIKQIEGIDQVFSVVNAFVLNKNEATKQFIARAFLDTIFKQQQGLDSQAALFKQLKFYEGLLYNSNVYLMALSINTKNTMSHSREIIIANIDKCIANFEGKHHIPIYLSGMPLIRTRIANLISSELPSLLIISSMFLLLCIFIIYKSWINVLVASIIVGIGIVWSFGTMCIFGYKLTILTSIVPSLIVIIGIPNCIYFFNKYHAQLHLLSSKSQAIRKMLDSMGQINLFCNLTMAIGFFVFMFTDSALLQEFGIIAGTNIILKFLLSYALIPLLFYYLPTHKQKAIKPYKKTTEFVYKYYGFINNYKKQIISIAVIILLLSIVGMTKQQTNSYIIDDVPKTEKVFSDLRFFEKNFKGILPLEIIIQTNSKVPILQNLTMIDRINRLSIALEKDNYLSRPLSIIEGIKFARQAFYLNDSNSYDLPNSMDIGFIAPYLKSNSSNSYSFKILNSFIDSSKLQLRLSIRMADMGSKKMQVWKQQLQQIIYSNIDTTKVDVVITGSAITFLEGNVFIMQGLKESILWAILLITLCMLYLFRSYKILLISIVLNLLPLLISMGIMGFVGITFKPSTVIIFSIVLGISVDITIRYLVSFRQIFLKNKADNLSEINLETLQETFSSISFTAITLVVGFSIFMFSDFKSIQSLGWLTALSLFNASIFNLVFLPLCLPYFLRKKL